jgi:hypothetical protein
MVTDAIANTLKSLTMNLFIHLPTLLSHYPTRPPAFARWYRSRLPDAAISAQVAAS